MMISVKVIPGAKKNILKQEHGLYKVYVSAPPLEGRANERMLEIVAAHFSVKTWQVSIVKGCKSRNKVIAIDGV